MSFSSPTSAPAFDATPLQCESLVLPFAVGDIDRLTAIAAQKKAANTPPAAEEEDEDASPELQKLADDVSPKITALASLVNGGVGSEAEWQAVVEQNQYALFRGLAAILSLAATLYILGTLQPARLYSTVAQCPAAINKLLRSIFQDSDASELSALFRLLDQLLCESYTSKETLAITANIADTQEEIMECITNPSNSVVALATANMLLLNTLDSKRSLHRILMSKQADLSHSSSSSSSPASPMSPNSQLTTEALSRFSQELITIVNAGRLPSTWEEEAVTHSTHSGVSSDNSVSVTDMYQSTREVVRALPDRQTDCHALTSASLAFLAELFHKNTALDLLYTNDIHVLVEVIIRKMEDQQDHPQLLLDFLLCLSSIVSWVEFPSRPIKLQEIRDLLQLLQTNYPASSLTEEQQAALSEEEQEAIETKDAINQLAEITQKKIAAL